MSTVRRIVRIIGAAALAAALAACSAVKLGYNALDDVGYWWLDGYAAFTDDQGLRVREELGRLHAWHRANELPRLAQLLQRMEQLAPGALTPAQACAFVPELMGRFHATWDQAEPTAAALALQLSPRQLRHLQRKYAENNRKFQRDWVEVAADELKEKRFKVLLERLEMVYGRLEEPQRAVLRAGIERSVFDAQRTLAERQRRQNDLLQLLRRYAGSPTAVPEVRGALRGYVNRVFQSPDPAYRAYQQAQQEEGCRIVAAVHESTSAAQREQAVRRLRDYQRDLRELAAAQP